MTDEIDNVDVERTNRLSTVLASQGITPDSPKSEGTEITNPPESKEATPSKNDFNANEFKERLEEQRLLAKQVEDHLEGKYKDRNIPINLLIQEMDEKTLDMPSKDGPSLRRTIIEKGFFNEFAPSRIREEHLYEPNNEGEPLAHTLAKRGLLGKINQGRISADIMELQDKEGNNVVHAALKANKENKLPKNFRVEGPAFVEESGKLEMRREFFKLQDIGAYTMPNKEGVTPKVIHEQRTPEKKLQEEEPTMN